MKHFLYPLLKGDLLPKADRFMQLSRVRDQGDHSLRIRRTLPVFIGSTASAESVQFFQIMFQGAGIFPCHIIHAGRCFGKQDVYKRQVW